MSASELGAALTAFEPIASDSVVSQGGRVVRFIGDEIIFAVATADAGRAIARQMVTAFADHPVLPPVRVGLAYGNVSLREGDCFGPTVTRAARITSQAGPNEILADTNVAEAFVDEDLVSLGSAQLAGLTEPVELLRL